MHIHTLTHSYPYNMHARTHPRATSALCRHYVQNKAVQLLWCCWRKRTLEDRLVNCVVGVRVLVWDSPVVSWQCSPRSPQCTTRYPTSAVSHVFPSFVWTHQICLLGTCCTLYRRVVCPLLPNDINLTNMSSYLWLKSVTRSFSMSCCFMNCDEQNNLKLMSWLSSSLKQLFLTNQSYRCRCYWFGTLPTLTIR